MANTGPPSILVIDDEPDNFDVIETLLHTEGYQFNYASCGQRALENLDHFQPDVILLDVMMPNLNGIEVCRRIKAMPQWQMVPIVMITALADHQDLARCLDAGADDFISKPVNRIVLQSRVRSMLRIKAQYDSVKSLMQLREDMVNMVVHDMRNPLASILLLTEMVQMPNLTPQQRSRQSQQMAIAGHQLQMLIDSVLVMSKLESGKMQLDYTDIDVASLCLTAISNLEAIARQKKLTLISQMPDYPLHMRGDAMILRRVLDNLLANAIKFSPKNSQIELTACQAESGIQVAIADRGKGIPPDLRHCIFNKFEVGTSVEGVHQMGLGLAFCKLAIEAHGGSIRVEDHPLPVGMSLGELSRHHRGEGDRSSAVHADLSQSSLLQPAHQTYQGSIFILDFPDDCLRQSANHRVPKKI